MRRCLLLLMICLLPLRLWAGDAMAMHHAPAATLETVMAVAADAHPCHGAEASPDVTGQTDAGTPHSGACGDCSVCHGPMAGLALPGWATPALPAALPHTLGWSAVSAQEPPQFKPPRA